ncbi:hypothetical protein FOZ62_025218 [Perkinsus olseni]|uniref:RING-type domain-containing protein n=1 Tax=Perkinsus olseni TaxID=32597 RepID=A0A7J6RZH0_PEROL|nr:hypothetical protein FOZ62_025218 [Perkinsus olseni]
MLAGGHVVFPTRVSELSLVGSALETFSTFEESSDSCCCLKPIAEVYSRSIHHACCWICRRHGIWASDLQCEDIAESGWLWKKSKVVGTWRLRWCCVVMSQRALLSFEEKPDWLHNTHLQQSPTEKIPLVTCDLNEFQDTSCSGFTIDNRAFALPGSASSRHALLNWLMAIAFVKSDENTINRCVDLACEDVPKEDFDQCSLVHSDIDSAVSTDFSNSADDFAIYVHGTTGDHVALDCLELADLWLIPVASNRAKTASCELCHRLRARQDLCETRPCGHIFHVDCLYGWTRQSITHDFCPHCHTTFVYEGDGDAAGGSYFPSRCWSVALELRRRRRAPTQLAYQQPTITQYSLRGGSTAITYVI